MTTYTTTRPEDTGDIRHGESTRVIRVPVHRPYHLPDPDETAVIFTAELPARQGVFLADTVVLFQPGSPGSPPPFPPPVPPPAPPQPSWTARHAWHPTVPQQPEPEPVDYGKTGEHRPPFGEPGRHRPRRSPLARLAPAAVFFVVLFAALALAGCGTAPSSRNQKPVTVDIKQTPVKAPPPPACGPAKGAGR